MAMTSVVKDELSRVQVIKPCCRKAEVSTLLRFAGGLHLSEGRVVIEAELDTGAAAGGCARASPRCSGTRRNSSCFRPGACARATATWSG